VIAYGLYKLILEDPDMRFSGKTAVSMSHPDILHNGDIFPEPLKFKPERWFNATERQNRSFVPFGKGTRMCVGMEYVTSSKPYNITIKILC
jgi:cytochrome P450